MGHKSTGSTAVLLYPRLSTATFKPRFASSAASHKQLGVFPVPPTVRLPMLMTGCSSACTCFQFSENKRLRMQTAIKNPHESGRSKSHAIFPERAFLSQASCIQRLFFGCTNEKRYRFGSEIPLGQGEIAFHHPVVLCGHLGGFFTHRPALFWIRQQVG